MAPVFVTFYLPLRDNDGRALATEIQKVEDRCYSSFGGWTMMGYFKGAWRMRTGQRQMDTHVVYGVVLPEERLPELEAILHEFKARTTQEAIYLRVEREVDIRWL